MRGNRLIPQNFLPESRAYAGAGLFGQKGRHEKVHRLVYIESEGLMMRGCHVKDSNNQAREAWYICWDCQTNLGFRGTKNPPRVCDSCGSPDIAFAIPPDRQWSKVTKLKRD